LLCQEEALGRSKRQCIQNRNSMINDAVIMYNLILQGGYQTKCRYAPPLLGLLGFFPTPTSETSPIFPEPSPLPLVGFPGPSPLPAAGAPGAAFPPICASWLRHAAVSTSKMTRMAGFTRMVDELV
jgi:hypothetical protein